LASLKGSVDAVIHNASGQVVYQYSVLRTNVDDALLRERLLASLSGAFALLAAILASAGLYGVISYIVVRRTNEIGVRMALGALPVSILRMIVSEAAKLLALGAVGGLVLAVLLMRVASSLLYGLKSYDPATIAVSVAGMAVVTIAASLIPAARAARLDPVVALREQ
jgi:ABC-type antimicrobial peptide transport system permease subunit